MRLGIVADKLKELKREGKVVQVMEKPKPCPRCGMPTEVVVTEYVAPELVCSFCDWQENDEVERI